MRIDRTATSRNHVAHQPALAFATRNIATRNNHSLRDPRLRQKHSLDLARLDPEPAKLQLRIRTPKELKHPIGTPTPQVPGAVHPAPRNPMRVRNKTLRRQTKPPQIATRQTRPRNVKLPRNTNRSGLQTTIQNINPRVPNR